MIKYTQAHAYAHIKIRTHTYIYVNKVKLTTLFEGNKKAPFSIPTTLRCKGGFYSFPLIVPLYP